MKHAKKQNSNMLSLKKVANTESQLKRNSVSHRNQKMISKEVSKDAQDNSKKSPLMDMKVIKKSKMQISQQLRK